MGPKHQWRNWPQKVEGHIIYCKKEMAVGWMGEDAGGFVNLKAVDL